MKKSALKILALIMALALVMSFAACGSKKDETPEATEPTDLFDDAFNEETDTTPATDVTEDESTSEAATEAPVQDDTTVTAPTGDDTTATDATTTTKAASAGLNSTDIKEILVYYNAAVVKTNKGGAPKGHSTMKLDGDITGDGAIGAILKVLSPAAEKALSKNSVETDYIPGQGKLTAADVTRAQAVSKNGVTTITIQLKSQTDGSDADPKVGPVGRGIGTLGSIDGALKELGAELTAGRDTVKLTYDNAYIKCTVNESTGKITGGTWHYTVNVFVGDAKAKLGITASLKNLKAAVDYTVTI